ncbi:hypothetical protein FACS189492_2200 [Clostridia bacterium]|nr:hypothetical protein FACS189492_2200 [Clostridia bacterium]
MAGGDLAAATRFSRFYPIIGSNQYRTEGKAHTAFPFRSNKQKTSKGGIVIKRKGEPKTPVVKLKGLRGEKMLTQHDVAGMLGISPASYNRKENGGGLFDANEISRLTEFFNVRFEDIFLS